MQFLKHNKSFYLKRSQDISKQEKNWQIEKKNIQRQNDLKNQYNELKNKNPFKVTTGKLALWLLFAIAIIVLLFIGQITVAEFSLAAMIGQMPSLSPLTAMVGTVFSVTLGTMGYFAKSAKENSKGGITYEAAAAKDFVEDPQTYQGTDAEQADSVDDMVG